MRFNTSHAESPSMCELSHACSADIDRAVAVVAVLLFNVCNHILDTAMNNDFEV